MSDNTKQFHWILMIFTWINWLFEHTADVFVAGDLLWYPVEGAPSTRIGPDVMVAFGRPKGHRGSYKQWEEGNIAPQIVFEVMSPGNTFVEMLRKLAFYERHGVEEFYLYDPDRGDLTGWVRQEGRLAEIKDMNTWLSPRLQAKMYLNGNDLVLYGRDNQKIMVYNDVMALAEQEMARAEAAIKQAEVERQRAERLAAQLRALGIEPN